MNRAENVTGLLESQHAKLRDLTPDRALYSLLPIRNDWWELQWELPEAFDEQSACRRRGDEYQVVWSDEAELAIVIWHVVAVTLSTRSGDAYTIYYPESLLEVWASDSGFHDRLDDLAGVRVAVPA